MAPEKYDAVRDNIPLEEISRLCMESQMSDILEVHILCSKGKKDEAQNVFKARGGNSYFECKFKFLHRSQYQLKKDGDTYHLVNRERTHLWIRDANQLVMVIKETIALLQAQFELEKFTVRDIMKEMTRNGWAFHDKAVQFCFSDPTHKGGKDGQVGKGSSDDDDSAILIKSCTVDSVEQALLNDNSTADLHGSKSGNSVECIPKGIDMASLVAGHGVDQAMVDDFDETNYEDIVDEEFDAKLDEKYAIDKYEFADRQFNSMRADFKGRNAAAEKSLKQQKINSELIESQLKECNTQMKEYNTQMKQCNTRLEKMDDLLERSVASCEKTTQEIVEFSKETGKAYSAKTSAYFELAESRKRLEKAKYRREKAKKLQEAAIADTDNGNSKSTWLSLPSRLFGGASSTKDCDIFGQEEYFPAATRDDAPMVARASEDVDELEQVPRSGRDCAPAVALATKAAPATPRVRANNDCPVRRSARKSARADRYGY